MNIVQIEENIKQLISKISKGELHQKEFIYELLLAYGLRNYSIKKLRSGQTNLAEDKENTLFWKLKVYFKIAKKQDLHGLIDQMNKEKRTEGNKIRFLIVTDFKTLLAIDTKTQDTLDVPFGGLAKKFDFFLPWAGMEKAVYQGENPADVKAAEKLAKLFDEIKADNFDEADLNNKENLHQLNIFLSRLLFCYFAEDTEIFEDKQFTSVISKSKEDGSDLSLLISRLFKVLNQSNEEREEGLPDYLSDFPYVNGGLFKDNINVPKFTSKSRRILIECGAELDWSDINPDIFGSMFQAVVHMEQRSDMGQHYTSVPNIMKVIEPLFLNNLYEELEKFQDNSKKLLELQQHLGKIKFFDPACGSGNFLIIAYKELRKFEMELLKRVQELELEKTGQYSKPYSVLQVSQFYGIEIDDFAQEIAILSLWLAEHQMNMMFKDEFGESLPSLPLKASGNIICENAIRMDWEKFCVKNTDVFVFGNPPYRGKKEQTEEQKKDLDHVCKFLNNYKTLDFIACWFIKVTQYIHLENQVEGAFVSTNSITQGEQVGTLWPYIFKQNIEIHFAYTSFMWKNNARDPAGVAVVIIGLRNASSSKQDKKYLFIDNELGITKKLTSKINPYLTAGNDIIVKKRSVPISNLPEMCNGSMANDDGYFFKTLEEFQQLPLEIQQFYKQAMGAKEFYYDQKRYCLWLDDSNLKEARKIDKIQKITALVKNYRHGSSRDATKKLALVPHRFGEVRYKESPALIVPGLSAESREYFPIGYVDKDVIITNLAQAIYSAEPWLFALLSSKMNIVWIQATSGYFKKDLRYSPILSYNNFPVPNLSNAQKENLTESTFNILSCREKYVGKTIAYLYHPKTMPSDLKQLHVENDLLIDSCYRNKPFMDNEERLETLFNLYEKFIKKGK